MQHKLLNRQIAKATGSDNILDAQRLCELVGLAYHELDQDRRRTERANDVMTDELEQLNTSLQTALHQISEENSWFEAAMKHMSQGLCLFDKNLKLLVFNDKYATIYGLDPSLLKAGMPLSAILELRVQHGRFFGDTKEEYFNIYNDRAKITGSNVSIFTLDNGQDIEIVHQPLPGGGYLSTHTDITERRAVERQILQLAHHDSLTGMPNRTQINSKLLDAIDIASFEEQLMAVLYLDLDGFKDVNDTLGHRTGDEVLKTIADRLVETAGDQAIAGRLSGDEFLIVVPHVQDPALVEDLAKRLCVACAEPILVDHSSINISASIGVAIGPPLDKKPETIIQQADLALYRVKSSGADGFRLFEPHMDAEARERRQLATDLRRAIPLGQLKVHYQPQVDLSTNIINGYEALLRWEHPDFGSVPPLRFVDIAEETGQISEIGEWVLFHACEYAASWQGNESISVNLSPLQLKQQDIVPVVRRVLNSTGLDPRRLELEITESVLISNPNKVIDVIKTLNAEGVSFALDDFGTGFSSLSYLAKFPFQKIKIDRSFIQNLGRQPEITAIVNSIINLGRNLGTTITAEGIEENFQHQLLRPVNTTREICNMCIV